MNQCDITHPYIESSSDFGTTQCSESHQHLRCMRDANHNDGYHTSWGREMYYWKTSEYQYIIPLDTESVVVPSTERQ